MITNEARFYQLIADALAQDFSGWDFSYLKNRWHEDKPHWNYPEIVRQNKDQSQAMLDMGTGGGEFLATLTPLPAFTAATEGWALNLPIAKKRLEPLGVQVKFIEKDSEVPFPDESFDLVINRHESYDALEIFRILKPNGKFITQQVGRFNDTDLAEIVTGNKPDEAAWTVAEDAEYFARHGFNILRTEEVFPDSVYQDIGAIIFYLKVISWAIPDFVIHEHITRLIDLHNQMESGKPVTVKTHRYFIEAQKPD